MSIFSVIGSIVSGGATGLLGSVISRFFDYRNKKLDREHEIKMIEAEAKVMEQEWAARSQIAKIEGQSAIEVEDSRGFRESLTSEPKQYFTGNPGKLSFLYILLDFLRGFIRPALTVYLCILTTLIYFHIKDLTVIVQEQAILEHLINTVLYLTTTVILWWFGTRQKSPPPAR